MAKKILVVRITQKSIYMSLMGNTTPYPTVYGYKRVSAPEGASDEGVLLDIPALAEAIRNACAEQNWKVKDVAFTIASSKVASRETSVPATDKNRIGALVEAKMQDVFPVDPTRYIFSHVLSGEPYEDEELGMTQDALAYAAPIDLVDTYYTLASSLGMNVHTIDTDGNAVFQMMKRQVKTGVSMSVQINRDATLINIISEEKMLLQRVIPYGVNVFTDYIIQEEGFQIDTYDAALAYLIKERVLLQHLNTTNDAEDEELQRRIELTEGAELLIGNITRVIEYYDSRYRENPIADIIIIGIGAKVSGLQQLLNDEIGIPVLTPGTLIGLKFDKRAYIDGDLLQYMNCFGSLYDSVNFMSPTVAEKAASKGAMTLSVLIFALCMVIALFLVLFSVLQLAVTKAERNRLATERDRLAPIEAEYNELMEIKTDSETAKLLEAITDKQNNHLNDLIAIFRQMVPNTFTIDSLASDDTSLQLNAVTVGELKDVSALIIQLKQIPEVTDVKVDTVAISKDATVKKDLYTYSVTMNYTKEVVTQAEEEVQ